jgi:hypothetical protein
MTITAGRPVTLWTAFVALLLPTLAAGQIHPIEQPQPRTFPQFVGTWVLNEPASTGRLTAAPGGTLTITTTAEAISVAKGLRPRPAVPGREAYQYDPQLPNPEVYRFDGGDTTADRYSYIYDYSFRLVADQLALTVKTTRRGFKGFTLVTDAYSVAGNVLTVHRQFSSISPEGHIREMQEPNNNVHHTFVYRKAAAAAAPAE